MPHPVKRTFRLLIDLAGCAFLASFSVSADDTNHGKAVDAVFAPWDKPDSPGCAVGVIQDGALVHARGYGMANLEHGIPITSRTVFDIGSCSKQFTAFSILLLAQQRKLSLTDNIRKFAPEIPDYGSPILIHHLLHHTSGLRDYNDLLELDGKRVDDVTTEEDALRLLARQRALNFKPGERHLYSNTGYFLLAVIVKRVSGQTLREFAHERIFKPLGMTNTHFHDDHTFIVKSRATAYAPKSGGGGGYAIDMSNWEQLGDGALMTTIEDLLQWDRNFYDPKVGGPAAIEQMLTPGKLNDGTKLNYACGLIVGEYQGTQMAHHGGSWAGYRAHLVRFPERKLSVFVLGNLSSLDTWSLAGRTGLLFLEGETHSKPSNTVAQKFQAPHLSEPKLAQFTGTYINADGRIRHIRLTNDHLVLVARGGTRHLEAIDETRFTIPGVPGKIEVKFAVPSARSLRQMIVAHDDEQPVVWTIVRPKAAHLNLKEYAGTYGSEELNVHYVLSVDGENLAITAGTITYAMTPEFDDGFSSESGATLQFNRDKRRKGVTGFVLSTGRSNGLRFERIAVSKRTAGAF